MIPKWLWAAPGFSADAIARSRSLLKLLTAGWRGHGDGAGESQAFPEWPHRLDPQPLGICEGMGTYWNYIVSISCLSRSYMTLQNTTDSFWRWNVGVSERLERKFEVQVPFNSFLALTRFIKIQSFWCGFRIKGFWRSTWISCWMSNLPSFFWFIPAKLTH